MRKKISIVGATGLVGQTFLDLLESRDFPVESIHPFASKKSEGRAVDFKNKSYPIQILKEGCFKDVDLAFFSAGGSISKKWAPQAVKEGCIVIDNSSTFRMEKEIPLIVPEVNGSILTSKDRLIANPNCSTIQLCIALKPIHDAFKLKRVFVSTYQSLSGAGAQAVHRLKEDSVNTLKSNQTNSGSFNCIPQIGDIQSDGFSLEDSKVQNETKKILGDTSIAVSAFSVRVPTLFSHGEVVWVQLEQTPKNREVFIEALHKQEGLSVLSNIGEYPTNYTATNADPVYVGRIHQDLNNPKTWLMWIVADNLRKGAALNGIQIAELLINKNMRG